MKNILINIVIYILCPLIGYLIGYQLGNIIILKELKNACCQIETINGGVFYFEPEKIKKDENYYYIYDPIKEKEYYIKKEFVIRYDC